MGLTCKSPATWGLRPSITGRRLTTVLALLIAVAVFGVTAIGVQVAASHMVRGLSVDDAKSINDARGSLIQLIGGIGLVGGLIYTARTFALTRSTQRADRFTKAVEQIGDDSETVRAGGVHSLWLLTIEDKAYWPVVLQVLSALVRQRATAGKDISADIQAALTLIGDRPDTVAWRRPLDLRGVHLPAAQLIGANLERAWLDGSYLQSADLTDARLARARLASVTLEDANLAAADLSEADLTNATLCRANFYKTTMSSADVSGSQLSGARNLTTKQLSVTSGNPSAMP
jgi:hypothetical protein